MTKSCFIFAGETSGDLHGGQLIKALKTDAVFSSFEGVGGSFMRQEGLQCLLQTEQFQVMGFSDVLKKLPVLLKYFYVVRNHILKTQPACVILIDYPGFNLRLAKALRQKGYQGKIVHYICPSVWAHGQGRIDTLVNTLDLLLTVYPFEAPLFAHTSLKVTYIGNPLVEKIKQHPYQMDWRKQLGIPPKQELVGIFPGSRLNEIQRHFPYQLRLMNRLKNHYPRLGFAISYTQEDYGLYLQGQIEKSSLTLQQAIHLVPRSYSYELMQDCRVALAKSGTVTLELALHETPTVVLYKLSTLNYYIAKYALRLNLPHYCIVNILGQKEIFPEIMGKNLDEDVMFNCLDNFLKREFASLTIKEECSRIKEQLGGKSSQLASQAIAELFA